MSQVDKSRSNLPSHSFIALATRSTKHYNAQQYYRDK